MAVDPELTSRREQAFTEMQGLIREWRAAGRKTTTAGVTSALLSQFQLNAASLGFASNLEFWDAAEASGFVVRERLPNGHWFALLPGEELPATALAPKLSRVTAGETGGRRLPVDLWAAFVEWDSRYRRFWDREGHRAFFVPAAAGWVPETLDVSLFVEIEPATRDIQLQWMREFAAEQSVDALMTLEEALSTNAPLGAFRRELEAHALLEQWRDRLRTHVFDRATAWAKDHKVPITWLSDHERKTGGLPARQPQGSKERLRAASAAQRQEVTTEGALRERVLRAVEAMSFDELCALPLRAHHFLDV